MHCCLFCLFVFIPSVNQICQTSVLPILVTKRELSNVKISRGTSIVNANVAGREKYVTKVIYILLCFGSVTAICWLLLYFQMITDTVLPNSKVMVLNLHYTQLIFLCFWESYNYAWIHFPDYFNGFQHGLDKEIREVMPHLSVPPLWRGQQKLSCSGTSTGAVNPNVTDNKLQSLRSWPVFPFLSNGNRDFQHTVGVFCCWCTNWWN